MSKRTVVIGASANPERYAYKAVASLMNHGHEVFPLGLRGGKIQDLDILTDRPALQHIDTVSLYVGPNNQAEWLDYIFALKPKRIIFNPGTENPALEKKAEEQGIEAIEACTLVLLSIGNY